VIRGLRYALQGTVVALCSVTAIWGQSTTSSAPPPASTIDSARSGPPVSTAAQAGLPFSIGERATYDVKFGILHVGSGAMRIADVQTLRGHDVWHIVFDIKGGTIFYHVNDTLESWFDTHTLSSLRFVQRLDEGGRVRDRNYEIFPDRQVFVLNDKPEQPSVSNPLDDGSFLYFVRTLPLVVGDTYTFNSYFNPKANPVVIRVLRKERIQVPAGTFNAIVVQPTFKTAGIFSDKGEAHVWFSDDSARIVLQMKSKLSFGSLNLYLRSYDPGRGAAASVPTGAAPESATTPSDAPPSVARDTGSSAGGSGSAAAQTPLSRT
jgi:hypothetical protein